MPKSNQQTFTARKPLASISNGEKPYAGARKKMQADRGEKRALDRLILARSELSALLKQIDEVIDQSSDQHLKISVENMDVESFIKLLSEMHSLVKPWILRFKQTFNSSKKADFTPNSGNGSPGRGNDLNMMISPSPLVAWRVGVCRSGSERQVFLLTPLSKVKSGKTDVKGADYNSTRQLNSSVVTSKFKSDIIESVEGFDSPKHCFNQEQEVVKTSVNPSTSLCPLLNSSKQDSGHRPGASNHLNGNEISEAFSLIYQLPSGSKSSYHFTSTRGERNEDVLEWFLSPPKTCTLLDTSHGSNTKIGKEKSSGYSKLKVSVCLDPTDELSRQVSIIDGQDQQLCGLELCKTFTSKRADEALEWFLSPPKTCKLMEPTDVKILFSSSVLGGTSLKSKHPGESTLKKELWTKFEAASKSGSCSKASLFQKTARKAFMDMLEEASSEMTHPF
ncbi:hypothetical protein AXF42_Ash005941 [Apostasia shenzhenica]|uniref:Uncharacterized protein n=1 Tax=Apostasia shenzhenica TaxID=1088818 RepID=A0A2I0AZT3_9ASPA|nr:hypothetical protein AXF42_Ash005941 [Apostasia shenzhenica]